MSSTIRIREHSWDPESTIELDMEKLERWDDRWRISYEGKVLGEVSRYTGSLDRKIGRLRWPGKQRTLWAAYPDGDGRGSYEHVSRAEAIRWMLR